MRAVSDTEYDGTPVTGTFRSVPRAAPASKPRNASVYAPDRDPTTHFSEYDSPQAHFA